MLCSLCSSVLHYRWQSFGSAVCSGSAINLFPRAVRNEWWCETAVMSAASICALYIWVIIGTSSSSPHTDRQTDNIQQPLSAYEWNQASKDSESISCSSAMLSHACNDEDLTGVMGSVSSLTRSLLRADVPLHDRKKRTFTKWQWIQMGFVHYNSHFTKDTISSQPEGVRSLEKIKGIWVGPGSVACAKSTQRTCRFSWMTENLALSFLLSNVSFWSNLFWQDPLKDVNSLGWHGYSSRQ